ncbi:MAG TPA: purine-nucleoside phosphorylase [Acidimicrobiia bacterium]|nr:purine-nucleoside phosphorylase [Acidimicrobiia bacterium]
MTDPYAAARDAATRLAELTSRDRHDAVVVLGSGWSDAADDLGETHTVTPLADLPGVPAPTVGGHRGELRSMTVGDHAVLVLNGRSHLYEGHSPDVVVHGVRTAIMAGCSTVVLTNAAGSLRPDVLRVGEPVLIADQLNLTGHTPLGGPPPPSGFPSRFTDLVDAYSPALRALAREVDPTLHEGVYAGLLGGAYETPAEIRMLATFGADLVGMSTVLETIAARHLGAQVLGISLVTNPAAGLASGGLDHAEVLATGRDAGSRMVALLRGVLERLG